MADHLCPWWMGYFLANPLRRLVENPDRLLQPFVKEGMTVLDYGSGMGYFTLPMARMVGPQGKVIAVDLQQKMLDGMLRRAGRAGLLGRIEPVLAGRQGVVIDQKVDFVAALYVVHELPDAKEFFVRMHGIMKPAAKLLFAEPKGHVSAKEFETSLKIALAAGLNRATEPVTGRGRTAILEVGQQQAG